MRASCSAATSGSKPVPASAWMSASVAGSDDALEIADIVERVVAAEDVDTRQRGDAYEGVDDVVGHLAVTGERLAADQSEKRRARRRLIEGPQPGEGVFGEEAQSCFEGGPAE